MELNCSVLNDTDHKMVTCEKCNRPNTISFTVEKEKNNCEICGTPYTHLKYYIVAMEYPDFDQEFIIVPGKSPEDALRRFSFDSPGCVRNSRRIVVGLLDIEYKPKDVGLDGELPPLSESDSAFQFKNETSTLL